MQSKRAWIATIGVLMWVVLAPMMGGQTSERVSERLPDLQVTGLQLNPEFPEAHQITDIVVRVQNTGTVAAQPSRLVVRVNQSILGAQWTPALPPGDAATLTFGWVARKGKQRILAHANAFNDIQEAVSDNNTLERAVEFTPDLVIESVRFDPPNPQPNLPTSVVITVRNVGGQSTRERAALRFKDGRTVLGTLFVGPLSPGQSVEIVTRWQPQRGEHVVRFEVDALETIVESDELNNAHAGIVNVSTTPPTGANLIVQAVNVEPASPQPGTPVTLSARVTNVGRGPASDFDVAFTVDGRALEAVRLTGLAPGESQRVSLVWNAPAGEHLLRVKADQHGAIVEANEADNAASRLLQVGPLHNGCTQLIYLEIEPEAVQLMASTLGISEEEVETLFLPQIKANMVQDFEGINVRFTLKKPQLPHSRLRLVGESRQAILGIAPLDFDNRSKSDIGTVFLGSFVGLGAGRLQRFSLDRIALAITNTASHEAGHFLGLTHDEDAVTDRFRGRNLMAPSNEANTFFEDASFTNENLAYLHDVLPLTCN